MNLVHLVLSARAPTRVSSYGFLLYRYMLLKFVLSFLYLKWSVELQFVYKITAKNSLTFRGLLEKDLLYYILMMLHYLKYNEIDIRHWGSLKEAILWGHFTGTHKRNPLQYSLWARTAENVIFTCYVRF